MLKNAHTAGSCRLPEGSSGKEWNAALCAIRNLTDRVFFFNSQSGIAVKSEITDKNYKNH